MRPLNLVIVISCLILFNSCQKEIDGSGNDTVSRIRTYTEDVASGGDHITETFNVTYDAEGRVSTLESVTTPGNRFVYTYKTNNNFQMEIFAANVVVIHEEYYLNGFSLVDSTFQYNNTGDSLTEKYYYNGSRQLIQYSQYNYHQATGPELYSIVTATYDGEGNIIKQTEDADVTTFDYYSDLVNPLTYLNPYMVQSPKLVKTATMTSGGATVVFTHTYTFDSQNRLTSEKVTEDDNDTIVIKSYTY